jgi:hypothetical protein
MCLQEVDKLNRFFLLYQNQLLMLYKNISSHNNINITSDQHLQIYKTLQIFTSLIIKYANTNYLIQLLKMPSMVAWFRLMFSSLGLK